VTGGTGVTTRLPVGVFFALFTASGFAGLIYQSIWSHYLKLFLGHAAYAQTLVLAIFMGGMAVGAWGVSRFTHRIRDLLLGYAIAELGIGLLALAFHPVFLGATGWAFDTILPALGGSGTVDLFKWSLASLLILPASILLGTTFPLMSAGILRLYPESGGRALSMLYFTNSFGAAFGVLASGFYLIDKVGLPGTVRLAGAANIVLALTVWLIARRLPPAAPMPTAASASAGTTRLGRAILILAFATGAASFIYEITWIRMLSLALGASTHAFEVMLAAFILAMSLGALWFRNRIARLANDLYWLAGLLVAKALFAAWAVWIYGDVLELVQWVSRATSRTDGGYVLTTFSGFLASCVVMFPAAFCAGMTLPLATHVLTSRGHGEASIGRVYGANTAGCIAGAIFATHVGMELAGIKGLTGIGALLDVAMGALVLAAAGALRTRMAGALALVVVAGTAVYAAARMDTMRMSSGVYRQGSFIDPAASKLQFYRDGKTATISVVDFNGTLRSIRTNGKADASVQMDPNVRPQDDEYTMTLAAALPLLMNPGIRTAANIGLGSGITTHSLLGNPELTVVDTIEIERMMIEGARLYAPLNSRAFSDPRSRIHVEDAKTFFAAHGKQYDVIISEPSNPWVSGVSTLFSEEFYGQLRRYLTKDGLFVQWVQAYEINLPLIASVFNALGNQFGDYAVYRTTGDLLVVATPAAKLPPLSAAAFAHPGLGQDLRRLGILGPQDIEAMRVGSRATLEPMFRNQRIAANSDYYPILDQRASRARFKQETALDLPNLRNDLMPLLQVLDRDTRLPLERLSTPVMARSIQVDRAFVAAEAVGVALTGAAGRAQGLPPAARNAALVAWRLADDCGGAEAQWLEAVTETARLIVPHLAGADGAPFFARMLASRCARSLDEAGRRRLEFLAAANTHDTRRMAAAAEWLLENGQPSPAARIEYASAVLLNGVANAQDPAARSAVDRLLLKLPLREARAVPLEFMLAHWARTRERQAAAR
jgi:spermidine synthase